MKIVLILALLIGAAWYYASLRGRLTVRAYTYLSELSYGGTEEAANKLALSIDLHAASKLSGIAMEHVKYTYAGNQSAMISHARLKGFRG